MPWGLGFLRRNTPANAVDDLSRMALRKKTSASSGYVCYDRTLALGPPEAGLPDYPSCLAAPPPDTAPETQSGPTSPSREISPLSAIQIRPVRCSHVCTPHTQRRQTREPEYGSKCGTSSDG